MRGKTKARTDELQRRPARGFSMLELVIVLAISMVVAALAIPNAINAAQNFKLRSSASSVSGLIQRCRMLSVSSNNFYPMLSTASGNYHYAFIGQARDFSASSTPDLTKNVAQLPAGMIFDNFGDHPSDATINNGQTPTYGLPTFNPRGLPCFVTSGQCNPNAGNIYIAFIRQSRSLSTTGWAAITVTAAGRVRVYTWDGSAWE